MTEWTIVKDFNRDDMHITVRKIRWSNTDYCFCQVCGCLEKETYNIQFEKPINYSNAGGMLCKKHLKAIFDVDL